MPSLPLIDFSAFYGNAQQKKACSDQIWRAFSEYGFLYLQNCPISSDQVTCAFKNSAAFFALPEDEKMALTWKSPESNRGYVCQGREKVSRLDKDQVAALRNKVPDLKESMEVGKEPSEQYQNEWPQKSLPHLQKDMVAFFQACHTLHLEIMSAIAIALELDARYFDAFCSKQDHNLRLLHYPSAAKKLFENADQARAGTHTESVASASTSRLIGPSYGTVTLLFQDDRGGLEVLAPDGKSYLEATPVDGSIVINAGDLLARWTNDKIRSTEHRVVAPPSDPGSDEYPERYSIAFFSNPDGDADIFALPGCVAAGEEPKYPAVGLAHLLKRGVTARKQINAHHYLVQRLSATY